MKPCSDSACLASSSRSCLASTDGWQAAANLTIEPATPGPTTPVPTWTLALVGTATALGAVYSLWSRR